jgi:hypothetical protein
MRLSEIWGASDKPEKSKSGLGFIEDHAMNVRVVRDYMIMQKDEEALTRFEIATKLDMLNPDGEMDVAEYTNFANLVTGYIPHTRAFYLAERVEALTVFWLIRSWAQKNTGVAGYTNNMVINWLKIDLPHLQSLLDDDFDAWGIDYTQVVAKTFKVLDR